MYLTHTLINSYAKYRMSSPDALSVIFAALAHPVRRTILERLTAGERSVSDLAAPIALTGPAITRHLKVLEQAGLVERRKVAQWRPCRLRAEPLAQASDWLLRYRAHWEQRLDRLEDYLRELQERSPTPDERGPDDA